MKTILYHTASAATAVELDKAVNALLDEGYQLYGSPYLSDRVVDGIAGTMAFYQAMTLDKETADKKGIAVLKELTQMKEIKNLKLMQPN
jgi:hypothetical protein